PDVALFVLPEYGGRCHYVDNYIGGPPELVVEVSASTKAVDFGPKLRLYREAGIQEYVSVVEAESLVVWRSLDSGRYAELQPDAAGVFRSRVFPGLWLDTAALFGNDLAAMIRTLQTGLNSPGHAEFAALLVPRQ
ncbi:MAG: Uma2 family endonuclease, partial [Bryobacteraceae bacterium]|nr:Uma2 family endonuclease [Bryobacteraceae bacterium]